MQTQRPVVHSVTVSHHFDHHLHHQFHHQFHTTATAITTTAANLWPNPSLRPNIWCSFTWFSTPGELFIWGTDCQSWTQEPNSGSLEANQNHRVLFSWRPEVRSEPKETKCSPSDGPQRQCHQKTTTRVYISCSTRREWHSCEWRLREHWNHRNFGLIIVSILL